jgi:hypothetical protein
MKPLSRNARRILEVIPDRAFCVSWAETCAGLAHGKGSPACCTLLERGLVTRLSRGIHRITGAGQRLRDQRAGPDQAPAPRRRPTHAVWL